VTEVLLALAPLISAQFTARHDHELKRRFYQRNGVREN
jgi:hypothetical protein